jgi:hypothetical protein
VVAGAGDSKPVCKRETGETPSSTLLSEATSSYSRVNSTEKLSCSSPDEWEVGDFLGDASFSPVLSARIGPVVREAVGTHGNCKGTTSPEEGIVAGGLRPLGRA